MMWLKDKLVRNIVFSVVGIGLLVGAYYLVQRIPEKKDDATASPTAATGSSIEILNTPTENIKEVNIKNPTSLYTIIKTKKQVVTKAEDGTEKSVEKDFFSIKEYPNIEFSNVKLENSIYDFASISAVKEITQDINLDEFGLKTPQAVLTVSFVDGSSSVFTLGNKVMGDSGYFMCAQNTGKVYVIPIYKAESMLKKINDFRDTSLASVDPAKMTKFSLENEKGIVANIRPVNEQEQDKFSMMTSFIMTEPKYESVSADKFGKIIETLGEIIAIDFIADSPKDLNKYGLANPKITLTFADDTNSYTIMYGNRTEDNKIYAMLLGKDFVFTQEITMFESLSKIEPLGLLEKFAHIINIDVITDVIVEGEGKKHTLSITGEGDNCKYAMNGKEALEDTFKKAYQEVIGLITNGFAEPKISGEAKYTITFVYKDGSTLVNKYIDFDERNYALDKNGNMEYIILKKNLSNMMTALDTFDADPMKKPE